jgi:hypothetical protein
LYSGLVNSRPDLVFSLEPVIYPVPDLNILKDPRNLQTLTQFKSDAQLGEQNITADIYQTDKNCGAHTVSYVLAGYSLGGWAVHDALHELNRTQLGSAELREIAGVALFGDAKFVPFQGIVRDYKLADINFGMAALAVDQSADGVPGKIGSKTGSWCFPTDPVCQVLPDPKTWAAELAQCVLNNQTLCAHFQYPDGETSKAVTFLGPFLPPVSRWPQLTTLTAPPDGTVGAAYSWTATLAPAGAYTWNGAGNLPPGLSFSKMGVLSGVPTQAGTFTFEVRASTANDHPYGTAPVTVTINPRSAGWTPIQMPLPAGAAANPGVNWGSLVCPSTTACVGDGTYLDSSSSSQGFLVTGSGTTWTATKAPLPGGAANGALSGVACPSAGECVAVGQYKDSSGNGEGVLLTGSGTTWTATEAPLPGDAIIDPSSADPFIASIASVACPSVGDCVAVGSYQDSSGQRQGLLVTGSGTTWTATKAPLPDGASAFPGAEVDGVSCASATACVAIGSYQDSSGQLQGLLLTGSGTTWGATRATPPSGAAYDLIYPLESVACASGMPCVVVGSYYDSAKTRQAVLLTWSGTTWTDAEPQLPADASTYGTVFEYGYATCSSAATCVVAGGYEGGDKGGVLLTGSGTTWAVTEAPVPANGVAPGGGHNGPFYPGSVACPAATQCIAAGNYTDTSAHDQGMLLTGSGTTWAAAEAPLPSGAVLGFLSGIACTSVTDCVVGGTYTNSGGLQGLLLIGPG